MAFSVDADPASVSDPLVSTSYIVSKSSSLLNQKKIIKDLGSKLMTLERRLEEMEKKYQSLLNTTKQNTKESEAKDRDSTEV